MQKVELTVTGMKCGGCEANVSEKLKALSGVNSVQAEHKANRVTVEFDSAATNLDDIKSVISGAGFGLE